MKYNIFIIRTLVLFVSLTLCLGVLMDYLPFSSESRMRSFDQRYEKITHELYLKHEGSPEEVRIRFLGTSKTMCNIIPENLDMILDKYEIESDTRNYGVNWFGVNMLYLITKRLCETKSADVICVEVPYLMRYWGHQNFRMFCTFREALSAPVIGNNQYFSDVLFNPFRQIFQQLYHPFNEIESSGLAHKGWSKIELDEMRYLGIKKIYEQKISSGVMVKKQDILRSDLSRMKKDFLIQPSHHYYREIVKLTHDHGIKLIFIGIPKFGVYEMLEDEENFYKSLGTLLKPPFELVHKSDNWRDDSHYSIKGAERYTEWLGEKLASFLMPDEN